MVNCKRGVKRHKSFQVKLVPTQNFFVCDLDVVLNPLNQLEDLVILLQVMRVGNCHGDVDHLDFAEILVNPQDCVLEIDRGGVDTLEVSDYQA